MALIAQRVLPHLPSLNTKGAIKKNDEIILDRQKKQQS
jgi:hypothetical protein